jgi:hypothetical protein
MSTESSRVDIDIRALQDQIPMGRSATVEANVQLRAGESPQDYVLLPFVNGRRWGAHERPDADGRAVFHLPLPNPGPAQMQVLAVPSDTGDWMGLAAQRDLLLAGRLMPAEPYARSNTLNLRVNRRTFPRRDNAGSLFGLQWEPWFTGGVPRWGTTQAVPLMGLYDSYNRDVTRQHILWCMDVGIDFLFPDWTNHIWGCQHWSERSPYVNTLLHATQLSLEVLADMRDEGLAVPRVALFPGLSNGRPCTMQALNEELDWIAQNYLRNPRFEGLWQEFDGKPLIAVLDTGAVDHPAARAEAAFRIPFFKQTLEMNAKELDAFRAQQPPVDDSTFTVRWMSSQNDTTRHHELGYWSWMDGCSLPPVTYKEGMAEAATVSIAFFGALGWTDAAAHGRRGGATYLETFQAALQARPKVIFLHQFNEFTGQRDGHGMGPNHDIYVDTYNVEFSDDIEPVSLTAPGYRGEGGWGFYYLNLTQALMALYRGEADDCTLLAVSTPLRDSVVTGTHLNVTWTTLGAPIDHVTLAIDGLPMLQNVKGNAAELALDGLAPGRHVLTLFAADARTRYRLSWTALDDPLQEGIPVQVETPFFIATQS